ESGAPPCRCPPRCAAGASARSAAARAIHRTSVLRAESAEPHQPRPRAHRLAYDEARLPERGMMGRYEEICAEHEWRVPGRYNIAADVCDKHPRDKLAMVHEHYNGERRD